MTSQAKLDARTLTQFADEYATQRAALVSDAPQLQIVLRNNGHLRASDSVARAVGHLAQTLTDLEIVCTNAARQLTED